VGTVEGGVSSITAEQLDRATVPYYLRTEPEVRSAVAAVPELELVTTVAAPIRVCEGASARDQAELTPPPLTLLP